MARTVAIFHPQPVDAQKALIPIRTAIGKNAIEALADRDIEHGSQWPSAAAIVYFLRKHPKSIVAQPVSDDAPLYLTAEIGTDFDSGAFVRGILRLFNEARWTFDHWDCARLYLVEEHADAFRKMMHVPSTTKGKAGRKQFARGPIRRALLELYPNGVPDGEKVEVVMAAAELNLKHSVNRHTVTRAIKDHNEAIRLAQNSAS